MSDEAPRPTTETERQLLELLEAANHAAAEHSALAERYERLLGAAKTARDAARDQRDEARGMVAAAESRATEAMNGMRIRAVEAQDVATAATLRAEHDRRERDTARDNLATVTFDRDDWKRICGNYQTERDEAIILRDDAAVDSDRYVRERDEARAEVAEFKAANRRQAAIILGGDMVATAGRLDRIEKALMSTLDGDQARRTRSILDGEE